MGSQHPDNWASNNSPFILMWESHTSSDAIISVLLTGTLNKTTTQGLVSAQLEGIETLFLSFFPQNESLYYTEYRKQPKSVTLLIVL